MDEVILTIGLLASTIAIVRLLISEGGGTKGITHAYKTKSGKVHTATKSSEKHILCSLKT